MKEVISIIDDDIVYAKKFCNQSIKHLGKKYIFISFSNLKSLKEYAEENDIESIIASENLLDSVVDIKANSIYILSENNRSERREGKKTYVYKLQNIKKILEILDVDISKKKDRSNLKEIPNSKIAIFYSPIFTKNKLEYIKKMAKVVGKKSKVLIVDLNEFSNYKKNVGLSNIIFHYKENSLSRENLEKEICNEKDQDYIMSVTYPEDFNVINNIDIANIINELKILKYDYIFVNTDNSYIKNEYLFGDADNIILFKQKDNFEYEIFKSYLKTEKQVLINKITEFDTVVNDKQYLQSFSKQLFMKENE